MLEQKGIERAEGRHGSHLIGIGDHIAPSSIQRKSRHEKNPKKESRVSQGNKSAHSALRLLLNGFGQSVTTAGRMVPSVRVEENCKPLQAQVPAA